jgi:hypothetical protein
MNGRGSRTVLGALAAILLLAGCSGPARQDQPVAPTATASSTTAAAPTSVAPPPPTTPTSVTVTGTATMGGAQGDISVQISGGGEPLFPGGAALPLTVTVTNTGPEAVTQIGVVVSLGHCSCTTHPQKMMATGSMEMLDPATGTWSAVPYVREAGGTDFLGQPVVPAFDLAAGSTVTYRLRIRLDAEQQYPVTGGAAKVNVTITDPETARSGSAATAVSLPITVAA